MAREIHAADPILRSVKVDRGGVTSRDNKVLAIVTALCVLLYSQTSYAVTQVGSLSLSEDITVLHDHMVEEHGYSKIPARPIVASTLTTAPLRLSSNSTSRPLFSLVLPANEMQLINPAFDEVRRSERFETLSQLDSNQSAEPSSRGTREADDTIEDPASLSEIADTTATSATSQLDIALGHRGVYSDLLSLQDRIINSQRPVANAVSRYSTQSDNLNIFWEEISQDIYFEDGVDRLRPGVQFIDYSPLSAPGVKQYSVGADGTYRFNDIVSLSGDFWLNDIHPKNFDSEIIPTYDLFVTLLPNDYFRVDLDSKREIFDNVRSLQLGINAYSVGGSVDYSPTDRWRFTLRGTGSFYSDTNERQFGEVEAVWRVLTGPTIEVGVRGSAFRFSKQLNSGYFNPKRYVSGEALFRVQTDFSERLTAELAGAGGIENTDPGGSKPLAKGSLQLIYKLTGRWTLDGGISYFSSQDTSSSGFARTAYTAGLHYKFD